jgi:SAM-dependent methyltransferase
MSIENTHQLIQDQRLHESWAIRPVNPDRLNALQRFSATRMLDVGCGNGQYIFELRDQFDIHGTDIEPYESWQKAPERFRVSDICQLDYEDGAFGTVSAFEVLEHLEDPIVAVKELIRVTSRNVIVSVPNCDITPGMRNSSLIPYHWTDRTHVQQFTMVTLQELLANAGLKVIDARYINRICPENLLMEYAALSDPLSRLLIRWLRLRKRRDYYLTCLVVAQKATEENLENQATGHANYHNIQ